jgi:hypothetical protein
MGKRLILILLLLSNTAYAHPGRLDKQGGHNVRKDFQYKDGTLLKEGTYHYHRWGEVGLGDERFLLIGGRDDASEGNRGVFPGGRFTPQPSS